MMSSTSSNGLGFAARPCTPLPEAVKGRLLVVEDERHIRASLAPVLKEAGYEVSFAENGREALRHLDTEYLPDIIVLDLRMPVMDGWEFRTVQKDDPRLGRIPVVAMSADVSPQASAISAEAFLRKPIDGREIVATIERIRIERERRLSARLDETQRLASLGRLAAGVGHEINNPLAFVLLNLGQAIELLRPPVHPAGGSYKPIPPEIALEQMEARLAGVREMLQDCQIGGERIRETVGNLQRLSRQDEQRRQSLDVHKLIEQSVSMVWNQIRHRARLVKDFSVVPMIEGNETALGQVFLNLLVNAAHAMPEGDAASNEIRISTSVERGKTGDELVVEIRDSGRGISPADLSHVFEPFFTTKPIGQGTGLGLSISWQTVSDHGGRVTVESELGTGTVFRVFLPVGDSPVPPSVRIETSVSALLSRGRVLVIDDDPLIGRVIGAALRDEHDVSVLQRASEAIAMLARGETFDLILCDVVMPDLSGPEFYATVVERWPQIVARLVFMTGGAFTPETVAFTERVPIRVLPKPFKIDRLKRLVRERMRRNV